MDRVDRVRGNIPEGWWEQAPTPDEQALLEKVRTIGRALPRPGPAGSTFALRAQYYQRVDPLAAGPVHWYCSRVCAEQAAPVPPVSALVQTDEGLRDGLVCATCGKALL